MRVTVRLAVIVASVLLMVAGLTPRSVAAHPMGNFTINHYSALTVGEQQVTILYVIDMAEIPAYQELGTIRTDHSINLTPQERDAYLLSKGPELVKKLSLTLDGKPLNLKIERSAVSFPPGVGGLSTLRLEFNLRASYAGVQRGTLDYQDNNFPERIGWREIIATLDGDVTFEDSSVPAVDVSNALHQYSPDLINNPPKVNSAKVVFTRIGTGQSSTAQGSQQGLQPSDTGFGSASWIMQQTNIMTDLMKRKELPLGALFAAMAVAFMVGAAHALSPGHGKTVVAAYLVGSRGTPAHALLLGLTVTVSHTFGVFLIGFIVLYAAQFILPETLYPWLTFASGLLLTLMGVSLFLQRRRTWKAAKQLAAARSLAAVEAAMGREAHDTAHGGSEAGHIHGLGVEHVHAHEDAHKHDHVHGPVDDPTDSHTHSPEHSHAHDDAAVPHKHGPFGKAHTHVPADGQVVTVWNLLALGITGGILPCPSALVVLLVAIGSGQVGFGMLLILAFSTGLAAVLMSIGLIMVYSRNMLNRVSSGGAFLTKGPMRMLWGFLPMFSAFVVSILGLFIAFGAFKR